MPYVIVLKYLGIAYDKPPNMKACQCFPTMPKTWWCDTSSITMTNRSHNRPRKGQSTLVEPIRQMQDIISIKYMLMENKRDYCLFVFGINTAYRASELLSITCGQVRGVKPGDEFCLKEQKTGKQRRIKLNRQAVKAVRLWLAEHPDPRDDAALFISRTGRALTVSTLSTYVKQWCASVGLSGNYASHSLRKTWGYHQLRNNKDMSPELLLTTLVKAFGHSSLEMTLAYLGIVSEDVGRLFMEVEL